MHSLTLGSLLLTDDFPEVEHGYAMAVLADGASFGVAQSVTEVVQSLLADGDLVRRTRHGNREVTFRVQITGPTLGAVAEGEAALQRELGKGNTLTWQAPDILSAPTVFEVIDSEMSQNFDDLDELLRGTRTFTVTLTCAPFARSAEMVTVEALEVGTTTTTIDDCSTSTAWTGKRNGIPTVGEGPSTIWEAGAVGIMELSNTEGFPPERWTLIRTGTVDFTTTRYLKAEITTLSAKAGGPFDVAAYAIKSTGAVLRLPLLAVTLIANGNGYYRAVYDASLVGEAASIVFEHTSSAGSWQGMLVRHVERTAASPNISPRQKTRMIATGGTERTPASIHIASPDGSSPLGLTIVHTCPEDGSGYSPPLRRWRVSGNTVDTPRSDAMSGSVEPINPGGVTFRIPTQSLPMGGYSLVARLATTDPGTVSIYWSVGTVLNDIPQGVTVNQTLWESTAPSMEGKLVTLGVVTLPTIRTQTGYVEVGIQRDPASTMHVVYDEAWLFREGDDCALTIVDAQWPHLWLESPDEKALVPTAWMGPSRDNRFHPGAYLKAMGTHVLHPEGTTVFTGTDDVDNPDTSATFYRRWHSNAAE